MQVPRPILILKTGSTHAPIRERLGDFEHWVADGLLGAGAGVVVHDARTDGAPPEQHRLSGVVITGSHSMVSEREPWSEALLPWLRSAVSRELPVLGICYGHQLLAHALGGVVEHHPGGVEIGTVDICLHPAAQDDALLGQLPTRFAAQSVHWQSVRSLPPGARPLAFSGHEALHAFRVGRCAWGVQFHPEFSEHALQAYLDRLAPELQRQGLDTGSIAAGLRPTPEAASVLPAFARLALAA
ncbi:MAG TPA: glutamine amidotransferase [Hydrogenophaga sp.]|uniref:glutamine amidotransferase n=1 Tax=Hydrogenophaga sp. TaxID=1904254 RepID=UPI002CB7F3D9|nr:glutamine amidotransferase [Hydrogenophaga sp.]HMN92061.1 glutamine amidotransferase [Hydrogenophaga sp.]HMP09273.1 glutamine amidotransferase [Hydrogenophaga sp.]